MDKYLIIFILLGKQTSLYVISGVICRPPVRFIYIQKYKLFTGSIVLRTKRFAPFDWPVCCSFFFFKELLAERNPHLSIVQVNPTGMVSHLEGAADELAHAQITATKENTVSVKAKQMHVCFTNLNEPPREMVSCLLNFRLKIWDDATFSIRFMFRLTVRDFCIVQRDWLFVFVVDEYHIGNRRIDPVLITEVNELNDLEKEL